MVDVFADRSAAQDWFAVQERTLSAILRHAADLGEHAHVWRLAWAMANYYHGLGNWQDWAAAQRLAVASAELLDDPAAMAYAHRGLARALTRLGEHARSEVHLHAAIVACRRMGDRAAVRR